MANAEQSVPVRAASGLARISFAAAGVGALLFGAGVLLVARVEIDLTVAWLVFSSVVLAWIAVVVGAVEGVRSVREANRQQQPRLLGIFAATVSFAFLVLLSPILLWNLLFFVCDCVSP